MCCLDTRASFLISILICVLAGCAGGDDSLGEWTDDPVRVGRLDLSASRI
jgi:hypothetical protein